MKKKISKIGVVLACFAMICTSFVGYTLAEFMTTKTGTNSARFVKWGVEVSASGDLFSNSYGAADISILDEADGPISISVQGENENKVVAPGTSNTGTMTFGITGTPEVAVNVTIDIEVSDIYLKDTPNVEAVLGTMDGDYYPVVFTLMEVGEAEPVVTGTLAQIKEELESFSGNYQPGTNLGQDIATYTLTWSYAFTGTGNAVKDTLLGNLAAGKTYTPALVEGTDYELDTFFNITITVTQLD